MVGELAVVLLRHRRVEAAEPRLEVRDRNAELRRGERAGERRVDVARRRRRAVGSPLEEHLLDADERARGLLAVRPEPTPRKTSGSGSPSSLRKTSDIAAS